MLEAAVKFTISNSAISTVTEDTGLIVAMKPGQATITGQVCEIVSVLSSLNNLTPPYASK